MKEIKLTQGKVALVDDEDFEQLNKYRWDAHKERSNWYATRYHRKSKWDYGRVRMHRQILNPPDGVDMDHIDNNGLNNQKVNLRFCTVQQNNRNQRPRKNCTSKFKGVSYHKQNDRWRATINVDQRQISLGCYGTQVEAADAYNQKAQELFGDFARVNQI